MDLKDLENKCIKAISIFKDEISGVQAGRVTASMLKPVVIKFEDGRKSNIMEISAIRIVSSNTLAVKPYESEILGLIEKNIANAGLNVSTGRQDDEIFVSFPKITEERRKELAKMIIVYENNVKTIIRNIRHDYLKANEVKTREDKAKQEKELQKYIDKFNKEIEDLTKNKQKDLLTI